MLSLNWINQPMEKSNKEVSVIDWCKDHIEAGIVWKAMFCLSGEVHLVGECVRDNMALVYIIKGTPSYIEWVREHCNHSKGWRIYTEWESRIFTLAIKCECGEENTLKIHDPKI